MTLWQIWWLSLAIKIALIPFLPITPDEAYYFIWARHPALSYFDHPPFISWLMMPALPLWKTFLGVRLPGVIFAHLSLVPWVLILKKIKFSYRAQVFWMLAVLLGPLTGVGGFIITPDVPLLFFWSWGIWTLLWIFERPSTLRWMLLGLIIGLGMLSKYMMVLFFPSALIWMALDGKLKQLKKPGPWLASLFSAIVFLPVIIWNWQNHFASFLFQSRHGLTGPGWSWHWTAEYLSGQLGLLNPVIAVMAFYGAKKLDKKLRIFFVFGIFPLVFFFLSSLRAPVEANWPVCAYPSIYILAAALTLSNQSWKRWLPWVRGGFGLAALFFIIVTTHTIHPWLPLKKDMDHTRITREWLTDLPGIEGLNPVYTRNYQMAAFHSYYRPADQEVFKLRAISRPDFYDFIPESIPTGHFYMVMYPDDILPPFVANRYTKNKLRDLPSHLSVFELIPK